MKAREIIAAELFWPFEGVYGDPGEMANDYAARIVSQLAKAGFVILPKEPDDELITAMESAYFDIPLEGDDSPMFNVYRSVISHAEGEKG